MDSALSQVVRRVDHALKFRVNTVKTGLIVYCQVRPKSVGFNCKFLAVSIRDWKKHTDEVIVIFLPCVVALNQDWHCGQRS